MAQDAENIINLLNMTQAQRQNQGEVAQAQFNLAAKKLDIAMGVQKEMTRISDDEKDSARSFLLDVIDFAQGKEYAELDPQTQQAINNAVADSPLTLGMIKNALHNGKTALEKSSTGVSAETVFTPDDKRRLLAAGLTTATLTSLARDIATYGVDIAVSDLTPAQQTTVRNVLKGISDKDEDTQFIDAQYFKDTFDATELEKLAKSAGFTVSGSGKFLGIPLPGGIGDKGDVDAYLTDLMQTVDQYRKAGYSDKEILEKMQKG